MTAPESRPATPLAVAVAGLDEAIARALLVSAAEQHDDVARSVHMAAADDAERIDVLRSAVDEGLRTRRFLDYWGSSTWASDAAPVVDALAAEVRTAPSAELVVLLQRAAGHLVKVILRADDSNGMIGDLCREVLELHREACAAGVADPTKLAKWMVKFAFQDQDFFRIDPVSYADALGDKGLAVYRREVAKRSEPREPSEPSDARAARLDDYLGGFPSFAAKYTAERLAILDGDVERLVALLGGDLSKPYQFERVAEAMVELGQADAALGWAQQGIAETSGFGVAKLYDLAAGLLGDAGAVDDVVGLRRDHHQRAASAATYAALKAASVRAGSWEAEVSSARQVLAGRDTVGFIDALLADGDVSDAWEVATTQAVEIAPSQWVRLAEARESDEPGDAMGVYLSLADEVLTRSDKRAYRDAIRLLKAARRAAAAAGQTSVFAQSVEEVRERNRRRPSFMAMLDKARL